MCLDFHLEKNPKDNQITMRHLILAFLFFLILSPTNGQSNSANTSDIRREMAKIRQSTNWDDPIAAKKANEKIRELSKQLILSSGQPGVPGATPTQMEEQAEDKIELMDQILKSAREGEQADVLLGEPIRKKIKEEYLEDENPKDINPQFLQELNLLIIDMSSPTVQQTIDRMKSYKGVQTLVITGGATGAPVNLTMLINNAADYPLKKLYIINFRNFVKSIPPQVGKFRNLSLLALYNNTLKELPTSFDAISGIDSLFVDQNPILTLEPLIGNFKSLKKLGAAKTSITDVEFQNIKSQLPNCQILRQ